MTFFSEEDDKYPSQRHTVALTVLLDATAVILVPQHPFEVPGLGLGCQPFINVPFECLTIAEQKMEYGTLSCISCVR